MGLYASFARSSANGIRRSKSAVLYWEPLVWVGYQASAILHSYGSIFLYANSPAFILLLPFP